MTTEKILIGINDEVIELTGDEKDSFLADREKEHKSFLARQNAQVEKQQARESALAKLGALGLTEEEIAAL